MNVHSTWPQKKGSVPAVGAEIRVASRVEVDGREASAADIRRAHAGVHEVSGVVAVIPVVRILVRAGRGSAEVDEPEDVAALVEEDGGFDLERARADRRGLGEDGLVEHAEGRR